MCNYCEQVFNEDAELKALWFKREGTMFKNKMDCIKNKNAKKIGMIISVRSNCSCNNIGPVISIKGKDKNNEFDWLDLKINYCPMCGKQLREKLVL